MFVGILTVVSEYLREGVERVGHSPSGRARVSEDTLKTENVI